MAELNEYEYEVLDAVLEAFGPAGSLTRAQALEIFGGDEAWAISAIKALGGNGLLAGPGHLENGKLPETLVLSPNAGPFIKQGGFSRQYKTEPQKPAEAGGTLAKLQQQNMRLQNDKLAKDAEIKNLQKKIKDLRILLFIWSLLIIMAAVGGYFIGQASSGRTHHIDSAHRSPTRS